MLTGKLGRGAAEAPMEGVGEMAGIREAAAGGDVFDRQFRLEQQAGGGFETKAVEPFLGTGVESSFEVPTQLAGGDLAEFRQRGGPVAGFRGQRFPVPDSFEAAHAGFSSRGGKERGAGNSLSQGISRREREGGRPSWAGRRYERAAYPPPALREEKPRRNECPTYCLGVNYCVTPHWLERGEKCQGNPGGGGGRGSDSCPCFYGEWRMSFSYDGTRVWDCAAFLSPLRGLDGVRHCFPSDESLGNCRSSRAGLSQARRLGNERLIWD